MTAKQARRTAKILRDVATSLLWTMMYPEHYQNKFKAECCDLAEVLEEYTKERQVFEAVVEELQESRQEGRPFDAEKFADCSAGFAG